MTPAAADAYTRRRDGREGSGGTTRRGARTAGMVARDSGILHGRLGGAGGDCDRWELAVVRTRLRHLQQYREGRDAGRAGRGGRAARGGGGGGGARGGGG